MDLSTVNGFDVFLFTAAVLGWACFLLVRRSVAIARASASQGWSEARRHCADVGQLQRTVGSYVDALDATCAKLAEEQSGRDQAVAAYRLMRQERDYATTIAELLQERLDDVLHPEPQGMADPAAETDPRLPAVSPEAVEPQCGERASVGMGPAGASAAEAG